MSKATIKIKTSKAPGYRYVVDCLIAGKRHRKFFKHGEKEQAETYAAAQRNSAANLATEDAALLAGQEQRQELAWCVRQLQGRGKTLREAVEHFLAYLDANDRSCSVSELVEALQHSKEREGKALRYLQDLASRLKRFEASFGTRPVASIQAVEISDWLAGLGLSPVSRANYRRLLVLLFNDGIRRKVCKDNPAKDSEKPKLVESPVGILTVQQSAALLERCDERILAALAIGLFAGLRRSEIERLDWSEVKFSQGKIEIKAAKAKSARRRLVDISANLAEWLSPRRETAGFVAPQGHLFRDLMEEARTAAGIKEWPNNALRHSYASYHLAKNSDIASLSMQLGHRGPQMVFQHYREVVMPEEAEKFWQIAPASVAEFSKVA